MRARGFLLVFVAAAPALVAIWWIPWFVTQDGPAHAYTAHLLAQLLPGDRWLDQSYVVNLQPLPNLVGSAAMAALSALWPGRFADRVLMSAALLLPALSAIALRRAVRGDDGSFFVPFAVLLSLSRLWLLGFYSFLIGVALFNLTLAWWWRSRDDRSIAHAAVLSLLLFAGWFAHLVSFASTLIGLAILTLATRKRRLLTVVAVAPTLPLMFWYFAVMKSHSGVGVSYVRLSGYSVGDLLQYARSIKVLSIATHTRLPFTDKSSPLFVLLAPAVLVALTFIIWWLSSRLRTIEAKPWFVLAVVLPLGAIVAPDGFGLQHGAFLRERLFLLGLFVAIPAFCFERRTAGRIGSVLALIGLVVQSAFVWEYALESNRQLKPLVAAANVIEDRSRVFVIRPKPRDRFRASPTLHAANLLGLSRNVVVWNNYQPNHYFFPVNYRRPFIPCSNDGSCELREHHDRIDTVLVWNPDVSADAVVRPWFPRLIHRSGELRVYGR